MNSEPTFGKTADVRKDTTQINLSVVFAVMLFFIISSAGMYWLWKNTLA